EDRLMLAVRDAAGHYPIPLAAFDDLLDGVESDVRGRRYATFSELESYCRCVAGSIGRLCVGVFETPDRERAERLADDLGVALQLGNILRDLDDDLRRGRVYLPSADLERFGCSASPTGIGATRRSSSPSKPSVRSNGSAAGSRSCRSSTARARAACSPWRRCTAR